MLGAVVPQLHTSCRAALWGDSISQHSACGGKTSAVTCLFLEQRRGSLAAVGHFVSERRCCSSLPVASASPTPARVGSLPSPPPPPRPRRLFAFYSPFPPSLLTLRESRAEPAAAFSPRAAPSHRIACPLSRTSNPSVRNGALGCLLASTRPLTFVRRMPCPALPCPGQLSPVTRLSASVALHLPISRHRFPSLVASSPPVHRDARSLLTRRGPTAALTPHPHPCLKFPQIHRSSCKKLTEIRHFSLSHPPCLLQPNIGNRTKRKILLA